MGQESKHRVGRFYSWEICSEWMAIKKCDKSFFDYSGSGIPGEIRWFFDCEELLPGQRKDVSLVFQGVTYCGRVTCESRDTKRTRIFWENSLGNRFNAVPDRESLSLRFVKEKEGVFELSFIHAYSLESENDINWVKESVVEETGSTEGRRTVYYGTKYERSTKNRKAAIRIHGTRCAICGFDFGEVYGEYAAGFIEIHHRKALFEQEKEIHIDPYEDLIPVCCNCHQVIHLRKKRVLSIEEVRQMVKRSRK